MLSVSMRLSVGVSLAWHPYEGMTNWIVRLSNTIRKGGISWREAAIVFWCLFRASASTGSIGVQLILVRKFPTKGTFADWAALSASTESMLSSRDPFGGVWHPNDGMAYMDITVLYFSARDPFVWHPYEGMTIRSGMVPIAVD